VLRHDGYTLSNVRLMSLRTRTDGFAAIREANYLTANCVPMGLVQNPDSLA
jgi:hypothetical protein